MAPEPNSLFQFHNGILVDEFDVHIPWLVSEAELFDLIPERAFSRSIAGCPMLQFTLLWVKAEFGFNFVTHHDSKFVSVMFCNTDDTSSRGTFYESSRSLLERLGTPNQVNESHILIWGDDRLTITNKIWPKNIDVEAHELVDHTFCIFASFWIPTDRKRTCRR